MDCEKKWNIKPEDIKDERVGTKYAEMYRRAKSIMDQRTKGHSFFSRVSHMQSLYTEREDIISEGSTQAIKRKLRAETIQRVPDGEIKTQFDKNSIEQVETEFLFQNKVLTSEYDGHDMLKNLWRTFNMSYDYGYGCVRTGFEKDLDNDYRITYKLIQWNDILPEPDCDFIEEAQWYIVREYVSYSELKALIDYDNDTVTDSTYNELTVKYLVENQVKSGIEPKSEKLADAENGVTPIESVEVRTLYWRGADEFVTYVPSCNAILRTTKNYDPRKDLPLHFLILEPDPDFPLGCSSIMWTLGQQQFADAFQTLSYQTLLLATQPPLMVFGNLTNAKIRMSPRTTWPMGTNPNNKVEKFPVETTTLTQYGAILQNIQGKMMANMNVTDGTVASDANTMSYSGTPQGVEQQKREKTITVNQYQKRVEIFFAEWANHALRSYINAMSGSMELTVDEKTRRRIFDIEESSRPEPEIDMNTGDVVEPSFTSIINEDKINIDFDKLSANMLEFKVRTGSLVQAETEHERDSIQQLILPISQMLSGVSEENKGVFENTILQLIGRLCELSDVDVSQQTADRFNERLLMDAMQATMDKVAEQQQQIMGMQQQLGMAPQAPMGPEGMPPMPQEEMPPMEGMPPMAPNEAIPPQGAEVPAELPPIPGEMAQGLPM